MKTTFEYLVYGNKIGNIWMPNCECSKSFYVKFTRNEHEPFKTYFESLRDMLLTLTNDGDFQSCELNECFIDISYYTGNKKVTKTYDLRFSIENKDLFTEEVKILEFEY